MKRFSIFALAAVAMFVGCTKDVDTDIKVNDGIVRGELVEMSVVMEDTRVERDDVTGKLSWSEGDQVKVVLLNEGKYTLDTKVYTINITNDGAKLEIPSNAAYAIYPANIINKVTEAGVAELNFWQTHSARIGHKNSDFTKPEDIFLNNPMKGVVKENFVTFSNLMGYLKVPLTGEGTLKSVTIKNNNGCVNGFKGLSRVASYDLTNAEATLDMSTWENSRSYVTVEFPNGLNLAESPAVYIPVPENEYDNMALVIETTDKGANTIYAKNPHKVNRSAIKPVSATAINVTTSTPATAKPLNGTSGDSKMDYANTYIVSPTEGEYKFPCILADGKSLKGGVTAEIVWAEEAGLFNNFHYDPTTNTISFKSNGKEGNALIALSKNDNSDETIVWTWLLWCTDEPQVVSIKSGNNTYKIMDRVIGATWSPSGALTKTGESGVYSLTNTVKKDNANDACGLYYQYQNMIPYARLINIDGADEVSSGKTGTNTRLAVSYGFYGDCQIWRDKSWNSEDKNIVTTDTNEQFRTCASLNPLCMFRVNSADNGWTNSLIRGYVSESANGVFSETFDASDAKKGATGYRLWGGNNSAKCNKALKTNNDPCPAGYMIDNNNGHYYYCLAAASEAEKGFASKDANNNTFYGFYLTGKNDSGNSATAYFPFAGYRRKNAVATNATTGYIYTYKNRDPSGSISFTTEGYTQYYASSFQFGIKNGALYIERNEKKKNNAQAYNIRCRKFGN